MVPIVQQLIKTAKNKTIENPLNQQEESQSFY